MEQNKQYLQVIGILHVVFGGVTGLFTCYSFFHFANNLLIFIPTLSAPKSPEAGPLYIIGLLFTIAHALLVLLGCFFVICLVFTGYGLFKRKHYMCCLITACAECMLIPFGTALGTLTIIFLLQTNIKTLFGVPLQPATKPE